MTDKSKTNINDWRECAEELAFALRLALREKNTIMNWRAFAEDGLFKFDQLKESIK